MDRKFKIELLATGIILAIFSGFCFYFLKDVYAEAITATIGAVALILPLILKNPEIGIGLIAFFLPFERIPSISVGGFSLRINIFLILIVLLNYLIQKIVQKKLIIPKDPVRPYAIALIVVITASILVAQNQTRALQVIASTYIVFLAYFVVTLVIQDKKTLVIALKGLLYGAIVAAIFGFYQFAGDMAGLPISVTLLKEGYDKSTFGFARVQAFSYEPLYFANYIFIPLLLATILLIRGQIEKVISKSWAIFLTIALLINFVLAISRGAYLAGAVVFIALVFVQLKKMFTIKNIIFVALLAILVLGGSYLALLKSEPRAIDEFVSHLLVQDVKSESVVSRLDNSAEAYAMFQDHPILGVGAGNFGPNVEIDPLQKPDSGWQIVNNEYLEILAETGMVGFLAFFLLIVAVTWRGIKGFIVSKDPFLKAVLLALLLAFIGILVQYATFSTLYIIHIWFLIGLIAATTTLSPKK